MKNILATLAFYSKYPGWHSFSKYCPTTKRAVKNLEKKGFLEVNNFHQARFTGKIFNSPAK